MIIILITIFISEVAIRLIYKGRLHPGSNVEYQLDSILGYRYKPNSRGVKSNIAFSRNYLINSFGFPGSEFTAHKKKGKYRIIVLGSSDETGLDTDGPLNYIKITSDSIRKSLSQVEIINLSIDGQKKDIRNVSLAKGECLKYNPDLILFNLHFPLAQKPAFRTSYRRIVFDLPGLTDTLQAAKRNYDNKIFKRPWRIRLYDNSYIFRLFVKYYKDKIGHRSSFLQWIAKPFYRDEVFVYVTRYSYWVGGERPPTKVYTTQESVDTLIGLKDFLRKKKVNIVFYNTYSSNNNDSLKRVFTANNIDFLPLNVEHKKEYSFGKLDGHSTQKGHKAIAAALYQPLVQRLQVLTAINR